MKIDLIAGARPNFVKVAALIHAIQDAQIPLEFRLIHTGQHYDENLSGKFFSQLDLPEPDFNLKAGSGTQASQSAAIMIGYEAILEQQKPDFCVVVGDVTSSMACAITAKKMQVKVAHVEAGIRSGDWAMPEEVNRVIIDSIADRFFTTTRNASQNLTSTGISEERVHFVGNTMIDTLLRFQSRFQEPAILQFLKLSTKDYFVLTMHRPGNVDDARQLKQTVLEIIKSSRNLPIIFPVHPRTAGILENLDLNCSNLHLIEPLGYLHFNFLVQHAKAVITDSGGITEEATVLGVPCMTLRNTTERPETVQEGTNELLGTDPAAIAPALEKLFNGNWKQGKTPELWDGKAAQRIILHLLKAKH